MAGPSLYSPRVMRLRAMFARLRELHEIPERGGIGPTGMKGREAYAQTLSVHRKALNKARFRKPLRIGMKAAARVRHNIKRSLGDYGG